MWKALYKQCTRCDVDGVNDGDENGGDAVSFANLFIQNLTRNCGACVFCFRTSFTVCFYYRWILLHLYGILMHYTQKRMHIFIMVTKVCNENQNRCFLLLFLFVLSTHFCDSSRLSVGRMPGKKSGYVHVIPDLVVFISTSKIIFLRCHLSLSHFLCVHSVNSVIFYGSSTVDYWVHFSLFF